MFVSMLFCVENSIGQSYFTSSKGSFCVYNSLTEEYDICSDRSAEVMFKVSYDETAISFSTTDGSSTYYVVNKKVDDLKKQWWYSVVFSDGTQYVMVFDLENYEIRLAESNGTNTPVSYFFINEMWTE